ncbi:MAG: response regulator [Candidatus Omnitrophica bacterium]|nr:response regulator [Candidatus Omnitrophota bacterium]MBU1924473.1 response regulator [Candidatus Omnitrophota bacterium]
MQKKKVLVVDDEENFCQTVKLNLEQTGDFEVRTETDGKKALGAAREFKPDFIFLDIVMPDMDGPQVMDNIHKDVFLKDVPIVFLTALITKEEETLEGGTIAGRNFLSKPVTTEQLVECIKQHLK